MLKSGTTTRLKAGEYTIEIDAPNSDLEIVNNRVSLSRGKNEIVKIVLGSAAVSPLSQAVMDQSLQSAREQRGWPSLETAKDGRTQDENRARLQSLQGKWEFQSVESDGVVTQYKTPIELTIKENLWTVCQRQIPGTQGSYYPEMPPYPVIAPLMLAFFEDVEDSSPRRELALQMSCSCQFV